MDTYNVTQHLQTVKRIEFKTCPKCGGKMGLTNDNYGTFWDCISCGKTIDIQQPVLQKAHSWELK